MRRQAAGLLDQKPSWPAEKSETFQMGGRWVCLREPVGCLAWNWLRLHNMRLFGLLPNQLSTVTSRPTPGNTASSSHLWLPGSPQAAFQKAQKVPIWIQQKCPGTAPTYTQRGQSSTCRHTISQQVNALYQLSQQSQ